MAQPKILTSQADVGPGATQFVSQADLFLGSAPPGSGRIIQSVHGIIPGSTGTTTIPYDNTVPLITEGTEFGSVVFNKLYSDTHIHFQFSCLMDAGTNGTTIVVSIFRNTVCVAASVVTIDTTGRAKNFSLTSEDNSPLPAGNYTYSGRIGSNAGQAWYLNQTSTGNNLGGTIVSNWILTEHASPPLP